jgi:hypothetical protein
MLPSAKTKLTDYSRLAALTTVRKLRTKMLDHRILRAR